MKRRRTVLGRAVRLAGLIAVGAAIWQGGLWALVAAAGATAIAIGLRVNALGRAAPRRRGAAQPGGFELTLDLLRRAVGARGGWATGLADGAVEVPSDDDSMLPDDARDRGAALVELAAADGRPHVVSEKHGTYVAVGDYPYAVGVLVTTGDPVPVLDDLRRLLATLRLAEMDAAGGAAAILAKRLAQLTEGAMNAESVARAGVLFAEQVTGRGAAVVLRESDAQRVVAVAGADPRLLGLLVGSGAPVWRAIEGGLPVVAGRGEDVFGPGSPERRRAEREGVAFPLLGGRGAVGALVIVGPHVDAADERLNRLVHELGPRLEAARTLAAAEQRATTDPLTGLANRALFERRVQELRINGARSAPEPATIVFLDLDHFKKLNDTHGHAAGDAALRHVAGIFSQHTRDRDLVARIGGEEFAVWLPGTPLAEGRAVAERIRRSIANTEWAWAGARWSLTVSCGVAAKPDHTDEMSKLLLLADQALYRAKEAGRNRVEIAGTGG